MKFATSSFRFGRNSTLVSGDHIEFTAFPDASVPVTRTLTLQLAIDDNGLPGQGTSTESELSTLWLSCG
jgi:hypothetical protein